MNQALYMTAEEVATSLGVSVTTVYAYVSRKIIRSHRLQGERTSRYWRADIDRIRQKVPTSAGFPREGLATSTSITVLTEAGPFYRGRSAIALSESESLESTASLLWQMPVTAVFPDTPPAAPADIEGLWKHFEQASAIDRAMAIFPMLEQANPRAFDLSPEGFTRTGGELMRWFAAMLVGAKRASSAPLHEVVASRSDDPEALGDIIRRLLVLCADHELDPTTYAVRAVANSGVTPYRIVLAGLCATTGRRLTYGRADSLMRFLEEIATSPDPKEAVIGRFRDGDPVPGFGSRLYPAGDPRARLLLEHINRNLHGDAELAKLNAAAEAMRDITGLEPDFALVNQFLGRKLGFERKDGVTLRLGRIAGWIAHAMEQYHGHELFRPRAIYTGPLPDLGEAS
jgi:citrate synthase